MRVAVVAVINDGNAPPHPVELSIASVVDDVADQPITWLIRPPTGIHWRATKDHGITNSDVAGAPAIDEVWLDIVAELRRADVVAVHHAAPRLEILRRAIRFDPPAVLDTQVAAQRLLPGFGSHSLFTLASALGLIPTHHGVPRRAPALAATTAALLLYLRRQDPTLLARCAQSAGSATADPFGRSVSH